MVDAAAAVVVGGTAPLPPDVGPPSTDGTNAYVGEVAAMVLFFDTFIYFHSDENFCLDTWGERIGKSL